MCWHLQICDCNEITAEFYEALSQAVLWKWEPMLLKIETCVLITHPTVRCGKKWATGTQSESERDREGWWRRKKKQKNFREIDQQTGWNTMNRLRLGREKKIVKTDWRKQKKYNSCCQYSMMILTFFLIMNWFSHASLTSEKYSLEIILKNHTSKWIQGGLKKKKKGGLWIRREGGREKTISVIWVSSQI